MTSIYKRELSRENWFNPYHGKGLCLLDSFKLRNTQSLNNSQEYSKDAFKQAYNDVLDRNEVLQRKVEDNLSLVDEFKFLINMRLNGPTLPNGQLLERIKDWRYLINPTLEYDLGTAKRNPSKYIYYISRGHKKLACEVYENNISNVSQLDQFINQYQQK